jgi:halocyanin-like protein
MTNDTAFGRRTVLRAGTVSVAGLLAGCAGGSGSGGGSSGGSGGSGSGGSSDGSSGSGGSGGSDGSSSDSDGSGGSGGGSTPSFDGYLSETSNYDGVVDRTGTSETTVEVGVDANGGAFGYGPAAIRVDAGTTVVWEWTGKGALHNVVSEDGSIESEQTDEEGYTFSHTFEESGTTKYYCTPHRSLGMKGVVVVE